ncbi:hypothetical protein [Catellatospora citrea]|uniref:DinB family protein n=1 Tax=Catellatospora citrea TaxID=53366 RepID=A0A8J3KEB6_9ACTN|nr:hypothetical protein [Catellatospora citrea]GIF98167.1 hypothetical protein Cci01nite_32610 [Catellatospora citrea]
MATFGRSDELRGAEFVEVLDTTRDDPHAPEHRLTVRECLHVILEEEWEHHRYAVRDIDAIGAGGSGLVVEHAADPA